VAEKTSVMITIDPSSFSNTWNEYRYQIYCIKPLDYIEDSDEDNLPDEWELEMVSDLETLSAEADADLDGSSDFDEYVAGTHPANAVSVFTIQPNLIFHSETGRLYALEECTNLISRVWYTVRSGIPGTGGPMQLPAETNKAAAFHRLRVEKP
jgi:hypothetical protein